MVTIRAKGAIRMNRSNLRRARAAAVFVSVSGGSVFVGSTPSHAAVSASIVPGTLTQGSVQASLGAGTQYVVETNNLGDFPLNTGGFGGKLFPVAITNPDFNGNSFGGTPNTIVAFGNGGGLTLKFSSAIHDAAGQKDFGIFTAQGVTVSSGSTFNGNMQAAILVSSDNVSWRTLTGEIVTSPTTYVSTSYQLNAPTMAYQFGTVKNAVTLASNGATAATLNALPTVDYTVPMPDDSLFNSTATDAQRKLFLASTSTVDYAAVFGTSAGGNWFDLSQTGLESIQYLRLNGVNVGNASFNGIRLDGVFAAPQAVPEPGGLALLAMRGACLRRRRQRRAFSLVELLVVTGIIAILIGILLPVISKARASAVSLTCLSNLRQMAVAATGYAGDSGGSFPIAYAYAWDATTTTVYAWDLTTIDEAGQPTRVVPGLLWRSNDPSRIQQCPSFDGDANWGVDPYTGYNYNTSYVGHGQFESIPAPAKVSSIRQPSTTALFGDGEWGGGANKFMRAPFPSDGDAGFIGRYAGTQGFRHRGRTNVAFCDGHAESLGDRFTDNTDGAANVSDGTGFFSRDNRLYGSQ
jgi:prepilin-type processing-associated H-X9-DG protein/prepilin-type N-terminal cleavage/methylation domain-containing protein